MTIYRTLLILAAAVYFVFALFLLPSSADHHNLLIIAHRGASGYAPEHTIKAYELGIEQGGTYTEIDLQMTKDGTLIALHDETVERTTNGKGLAKQLTLTQIKKLDAGSSFNHLNPKRAKKEYEGLQIPTLEEIFQTFGSGHHYYIEVKAPSQSGEMEEKLVELLKRYDININHIYIQSFSKDSLQKLKRLNPSLRLIQLLPSHLSGFITKKQLKMISTYAMGVGPNARLLTSQYVQTVKAAGLDIHPYTVNDIKQMKRLIKWGVDGMFTDYPDRLAHIVKNIKAK
ncbi:glycerophosphodiester phosphodiesterase [Priestia abyssalis]|uniref:glycerophosphodiester phosphodiesterase n=1 Tax=Priestia abyssalis TaxID=1221450 RepID=UPI001F277275|nr:glycerophosphodiester phosphodiesterase [Priestia abyssalis]